MSDEMIKLSPSAINTYFRSPRLFYYQYVCRLKNPPNIHLYKGSFVHKVLEDLFAFPRFTEPQRFFDAQMNTWSPPQAIIDHLDPGDNIEKHKLEASKMLNIFARRFNDKIDMIMLEGKARDRSHAWNLIKPKLREHKIFDEERNIVGIIDSIETSFDETTYIIDYKTSKLYKNTVPNEYVRQVSIYAYLFSKEFGKLPNYAGINYLRYGETFLVPITDAVIQQAKDDIDLVRKNSFSRDINDYPKGNDEFANRDIEYFETKYPQLSSTTRS